MTLAPMAEKLTGPGLKEEITLHLHLTTLKISCYFFFRCLVKKMTCFWSLYEDYRNILAEKNWIIDIKRKDEGVTIKIVANESTINVNEQLKILNDLYIKHGIKNYGFHNFIVKEIISIKKIMIRYVFSF